MTNQTPNSKAPSHFVYSVKPTDDSDKSHWSKVGAAWTHGDRDGLNPIINVLGQDINLTIRPNKLKPD